MSIFSVADSNELIENLRSEDEWIELGVEYITQKTKGSATISSFASKNKIDKRVLLQAFKKYKNKIEKASKTPISEAKSKPKKKKTKKDIINDFRDTIRKKKRNEGASVNNKSAKWFQDTIKTAVRGHKVSKPKPGRLFAFVYDAKHKDTLPYWDKFPLIIYLGEKKTKNGMLFMGLNLHYIPPKARQAFLEDLLPTANTDTITNNTRLKINWSRVKGMRGADHMIKTYIPNNVKGTFTEIKPADWANVIYLPTQQMMSKGKRFSARKVWSNY